MKADLQDFLFFGVCISNIFAWGRWIISRRRENRANERAKHFETHMGQFRRELLSIAVKIEDARAKRNRRK